MADKSIMEEMLPMKISKSIVRDLIVLMRSVIIKAVVTTLEILSDGVILLTAT